MTFLARPVLILVTLVAFVALVLISLKSCDMARINGKQARTNAESANAAIASGQDAVATVGNAAAREQASEALGTANSRDIRAAEGASAAVAAPARDAGLRALCRRPAYQGEPRCASYR